MIVDTQILEVAIEALEGDGSTGRMPDVAPWQAAVWVLEALDRRGYSVVARAPKVVGG